MEMITKIENDTRAVCTREKTDVTRQTDQLASKVSLNPALTKLRPNFSRVSGSSVKNNNFWESELRLK